MNAAITHPSIIDTQCSHSREITARYHGITLATTGHRTGADPEVDDGPGSAYPAVSKLQRPRGSSAEVAAAETGRELRLTSAPNP
ncbi:hypothetical protein [Paraburkholderia caribensis]|uniref:hypothetical protein n=1 Tax=Paraburkholderia caribensis TaxID=75105 RepID=UPI000A75F2AE|nr:hypothetical protein [Paraburkholderia caribensis]